MSVRDGLLHHFKITSVGTAITVLLDNVPIATGTASGLVPIDNIGTYSSGLLFFEGILSDVKLTDITTPANSLAFGLDNLTGDTEANNGVTLDYRNIALTSDVRDTYTLSNNDTQWISDLRTIDIAEQA